MIAPASTPDSHLAFYVTNGTVPPDSPSYVVRACDNEIFDLLVRGELCFVLTSRQMGKSSLMARTGQRLCRAGFGVSYVDTTGMYDSGGSAASFYFGLARQIHADLQSDWPLKSWWLERSDIPEAQRLSEYFRELGRREARNLVVFIDEIDSLQRAGFSGDFFAVIRACHNRRALDPALRKVTFALLGVATPAQLINDPDRTPFNVGRGIELTDFTLQECQQLAQPFTRLGTPAAAALIKRIYYWTSGHPSLTQTVCAAASRAGAVAGTDIDEIVEKLYFMPGAKERDHNLKTTEDRLRSHKELRPLYSRIWRSDVLDNPADQIIAHLRLTGAVRVDERGHLRIRNRIYERVFPEAFRFRVALSFPGHLRPNAERLAFALSDVIDRSQIFYDGWYLSEMARPDANAYLQEIYQKDSELVALLNGSGDAQRSFGSSSGIAPSRMMLLDADTHTDKLVRDVLVRLGASIAFRGSALIKEPVVPVASHGSHEAYTAKLPATDATLIGRGAELAQLEAAWRNGANLVQVIAPGGTGKTALITNWYKRHVGEAPLFGWSFYKQGTGDSASVSSDDFLNHAVGWFQLQPKANTAEAKAEALVRHLRQHRTLLILDGMEPLQNQTTGELNDYTCKELLRELSVQNAGLVLCTSRVPLADLADVPPLELDNLTEADGARYLRQKFGVHGSEEDLRAASMAYGNHALALTLLGTYLQDHDGDLSRRFEMDDLPESDTKPGRDARRVMQSYARVFEGKPEGDILRGLGFFDRPAEREALKLVLRGPLQEAALGKLRKARLILSADALAPIDCHPLVREHFGALTKASDPEGFRSGHSKLFDHYCKVPKKEQPDTLKELTPLFHAVAHGCHAGRHEEARAKVYRDRIRRGKKAYLNKMLGAFGTDLSLLAHFFEQPWSRPVPTLTPAAQAWVTSEAAFALRALGRLADAVEPMRAGAEAAASLQDWQNAARYHSNLSQLLLTLGRTAEAVAAARESVDYADRSGDAFLRLAFRATLADALHQSGDRAESARLFVEAERLQMESQPGYPILYSLQGYQYCDLLLAQGDHAEALRRATQTLAWVTRQNWLLSIGLDHLTLGRAHAPDSLEARHHLEQAVAFLRRAGAQHHTPRALLARATDADLAEVHKIATRSGMLLYLADYHLAMARRLRSLEHLEKAEDLIQQTGYHRRDEEAAALRAELQS